MAACRAANQNTFGVMTVGDARTMRSKLDGAEGTLTARAGRCSKEELSDLRTRVRAIRHQTVMPGAGVRPVGPKGGVRYPHFSGDLTPADPQLIRRCLEADCVRRCRHLILPDVGSAAHTGALVCGLAHKGNTPCRSSHLTKVSLWSTEFYEPGRSPRNSG